MSLAAIGAAVLALGGGHGGHAPGAPGASPPVAHGEAPAAVTEIGMGFAAFLPARVDVVTGDTVRWENGSVRPHTVVADDGSFASGRVIGGGTFTRPMTAPGVLTYVCTLHAGMVGEIRTHDVVLRMPPAPATPGKPYPLGGRTALPGGTPVTIEADTGAGFAPVATAAVGAGGAFDTTVTPATTGTYRAVVADRTSEPVPLLVLDRRVRASVARHGSHVIVDVRVDPAAPGQTVVLQLDLRRRFGWWPVRVARLDRSSRARFSLALHSRPRARVLLTLPDRATPLASSGPLSTRG